MFLYSLDSIRLYFIKLDQDVIDLYNIVKNFEIEERSPPKSSLA